MPPTDPRPDRGDASISPAERAEGVTRSSTEPTAPRRHESASGAASTQRRSAFSWLHTLRWRLTLTYVGLLALLMVALAFSLNAILGTVFFNNDWDALYNEAKSGVLADQHNFDTLVYGHPLVNGCAGTLSYQDAFQLAIAQPLVSTHAGVQAAYLLDSQSPDSVAAANGDTDNRSGRAWTISGLWSGAKLSY